jgi:protein tyrosine/serine phosphatase
VASFVGLLNWPECRNVRDLGGLPVPGRRRIRRGAMVRADSLDRLNADGVGEVRRYGVSRILDLRSGREIAAPHPFATDSTYRLVPFIDEIRDLERDPASEHTLGDLYRGSIDRNGRQAAALVREIAAAPDGAVVVHCLSGADRTGMLVALILDHLGVDRAAISEDYGRTRECLGNGTARPATNSFIAAAQPEPDTILDTLHHIDARHDGATEYLRNKGVTDRQLDLLRQRLVE